ncbi:ADL075Wp [Eremothecium gossypii ATCC 10895]|uniref:Cyclin n=1 Tax=Eremothecium gossypii (strain ATCC 10895 / CBS 109.51 / FGSC 9923 / NRRL Y-1056) TaxID=284811 RepID=Q75AK2_EREGS|nr:ADL075Wp [Eremothecium gossypii ATCC 10895]AAS51845.1 ADL075Wp [Eremothecium gossypii ATCC 10895]AEY96142.1 FADL075Wp [Eremothecium gossypii FDAG1]
MHCSQPEGVDQRIGHMDIAQFPTDKLLEMLTGLLYKIIKSNDRLKPFDQEKHDINNKYVAHVLSFRGKHIPTITLGDYFARIQKYCPITNDVFLSLLVYFDRIAKRCNALDPQLFVMDSYNIHRLIIAAVTVSTKFFSDFFYSNSRYARVGGISLEELNRLELQFSILCDFELIVSIQELQRYADLLYKFWHREHLAKASTNAAVPH